METREKNSRLWNGEKKLDSNKGLVGLLIFPENLGKRNSLFQNGEKRLDPNKGWVAPAKFPRKTGKTFSRLVDREKFLISLFLVDS